MVLSRDHHDVSGTDSPFRETSNIYDGSAFCAGEEDKKFFFNFLMLDLTLFRNQLIHSASYVAKNVLASERIGIGSPAQHSEVSGTWDFSFLNWASARQNGTVGCPRLGCAPDPVTCWANFSKT